MYAMYAKLRHVLTKTFRSAQVQLFFPLVEWGYSHPYVYVANHDTSTMETYHNWGKLRASFCNILRKVVDADAIGAIGAVEVLVQLANVESITALQYFTMSRQTQNQPRQPAHTIFDTVNVMSDSSMECGGFMFCLGKSLKSPHLQTAFLTSYMNSINVLVATAPSNANENENDNVNEDDDIRCAVGESLLTVATSVLSPSNINSNTNSNEINQALAKTLYATIFTIFQRNPVSSDNKFTGVSFDDSITLAIVEFLEAAGSNKAVLEKLGEIFHQNTNLGCGEPYFKLGFAAGERKERAEMAATTHIHY